jgi:queuosine precursor transporter
MGRGLQRGRLPLASARMDTLRTGLSRSLFALSIFYGGMVCIAGVLGNKQVSLGPVSALGDWVGVGPLAVEAGIFAFLLLVAVSSAVAELHGAAVARRLVVIGFAPLLVSVALTELVLHLPASPSMEPARRDAFQLMMGSTWRIWLGGITAYGISQLLNVTLFSALRAGGGRLLWLRAAISSVLSQVADTLIFVTVAFYGVFPVGELLVGQMLAKVVLSVVLVPPLIYLFVAFGHGLDGGRRSQLRR